MIDPVPWFVAAPAEHSAEVARTLAYQAIGGKEGLARSGDLLVRALPVPGGAVQVLPGAAGILNRSALGQAYIGRVGAAVSVPIAATGSGAGRTDLIVFRVDDPQYGGDVPPSAEQGPYIRIDVISGVNANVTRVQDVPGHEADSAVTLARVTLPASTGTVTDAMVTNVSRVANPLQERVVRSMNLGELGKEARIPITSTTAYPGGGQTWPNEAENAGILDVYIPEWATKWAYSITWSQLSVAAGSGNAWGDMWLQVGASVDPDNWKGSVSSWDVAENSGAHTMMMRVAETRDIPDVLRGKTKRFYPRANRTNGAQTRSPRLMWATSFEIDVTFFE